MKEFKVVGAVEDGGVFGFMQYRFGLEKNKEYELIIRENKEMQTMEAKMFFVAIVANNELNTVLGTKEDALSFVEKVENIKTIHVHHSTEAKVFFNADDAKGYLI